ncbi:hypothetical protein Tco_1019208 [Tanacetum coccineum]|uniref:Reverse transcriptase domain-containing protein n=1 Tax=Tanacetum coccineum TaxID=301880 RepID=A0ABQ5FXT1_9ASTR
MDLKTKLETATKNHQASIQNLKAKFDILAYKQSAQPFGSIPSKTQPNPKGSSSKAYQPPQAQNEHVNVVFTRSGKSYDPPINPNDQPNDSETPVNFDSDDEDEESTPQPEVKDPKPVKETSIPKPYKLKIPYPQRLRKEKREAQYAIFHDMIEESVEVFMDGFSVFGNSFDNCLKNLNKMLQCCKDANLVLNWEKCHFMVKEEIVFGHKVSGVGLEVDKAKIDVISKLPPPTNVKGIRSFLGHDGFYRRFFKDFSKITRPLTKLLEKDTPFGIQ